MTLCSYTKTENAPYPRVEYKSDCGFILVKTEGYNSDFNSEDFGELIHPKGVCLKCKNRIK